MHHFFVTKDQISKEEIKITGRDVNHIKNVLRMKVEEELLISNGEGEDYCCKISKITDTEILLDILAQEYEGTELKVELYLFQGIPKSDKMEMIIQKAVELGVYQIIPVFTQRCVIRLDEKRAESKRKRWQAIAESAAKQSRRGIIPEVKTPMNLKEAIDYAATLEETLIPYENYKDLEQTGKVIQSAGKKKTIGIFIGPEGGFEEYEVEYAIQHGMKPISLGRRILRTETAGIMLLSIFMFQSELSI